MSTEYYESMTIQELKAAAKQADRDVKRRNAWLAVQRRGIWTDEIYLKLLKKADTIDEILRKREEKQCHFETN